MLPASLPLLTANFIHIMLVIGLFWEGRSRRILEAGSHCWTFHLRLLYPGRQAEVWKLFHARTAELSATAIHSVAVDWSLNLSNERWKYTTELSAPDKRFRSGLAISQIQTHRPTANATGTDVASHINPLIRRCFSERHPHLRQNLHEEVNFYVQKIQ